MLTAYSRCLTTLVNPRSPHRVGAAPGRLVAPSPRLHSPTRLPGAGLRGAWRQARCKHLHRTLKAGLDAGQRLGWATGCRAPPSAHLGAQAASPGAEQLFACDMYFMFVLFAFHLPVICVGLAVRGYAVLSHSRGSPGRTAGDLHPPDSNSGRLLSACSIPDPVLSPPREALLSPFYS